MSTVGARSSELPEPATALDGDGDSPVFGVWAAVLTLVLLSALVVGLWATRGL